MRDGKTSIDRSRGSFGRTLLKNVGSAFAGRFAGAALGIVTFAVLARGLGAPGLGAYRSVLTLLLFAGIVFDFGLYSISLRELSRPGADQPRILGNAVTLRLLGTTCGVALLLGLLAFVHSGAPHGAHFGPTVRWGVLVAGAGWIGQQLNEFLRAVFQLKLVQHRSAVAETVGAILSLLLIATLAAAHAGVIWMLAATSTGFLCTALLAWVYANQLIPIRPRMDWPVWRTLLIAGLPMAASVLFLNVQLRVDVLLLSLLRAPVEVGLYDVPFKLYELLYVLPALFGGLMMPIFVRDHSAGRDALEARLNGAVGVHLFVSILICGGLYVCAEPLAVLIAGKPFAASADPLRVLGVAAVFVGTTAILRFAAIALERQHQMLRADAIGACAAVLAHLYLIPRYGIIGAATAKLCGDVVTCAAAVVVLNGRLNRSLIACAVVGVIAAAGLTQVAGWASQLGVPALIACCGLAPFILGAAALTGPVRRACGSLAAPDSRRGPMPSGTKQTVPTGALGE